MAVRSHCRTSALGPKSDGGSVQRESTPDMILGSRSSLRGKTDCIGTDHLWRHLETLVVDKQTQRPLEYWVTRLALESVERTP